MSAAVENGAPNGGDGNADGIPDADQANVASLPSALDVNGDGARNDYVTIESPAGTSLSNVRALPVPAGDPPPIGVRLPVGLFDYDVNVAQPGDRADVRLYLPESTQRSVFMLQHGTWTDFSDHAQIDDGANLVTVGLTDGGAGDAGGTPRRGDRRPGRSG